MARPRQGTAARHAAQDDGSVEGRGTERRRQGRAQLFIIRKDEFSENEGRRRSDGGDGGRPQAVPVEDAGAARGLSFGAGEARVVSRNEAFIIISWRARRQRRERSGKTRFFHG